MIKDQARQILRHYGIIHQKSKAIEEFAELIVALQKDILEGKENHSRAVLEEIADVHIMLTQLLDDESDKTTVSLIVDKKLKRQMRRIEAEKNSGKACKSCCWHDDLNESYTKVCRNTKSEEWGNLTDDTLSCPQWEE